MEARRSEVAVGLHEKTTTHFSLQSVEKQQELEDAAQTIYKKIIASPPTVVRTPRRPTVTVRVSKTKREVWDGPIPHRNNSKEMPPKSPKSVKLEEERAPLGVVENPTQKPIIQVQITKTHKEIWDFPQSPKSVDTSQLQKKRHVDFSDPSPQSENQKTATDSDGPHLTKKASFFRAFGTQKRKSVVQVQIPLDRKLEVWDSILPEEREPNAQFSKNEGELDIDEESNLGIPKTTVKPNTLYRPRSSYHVIQQWFFTYMNKFASECARYDLNLSQYPSIEREDNSKILGTQFLDAWYAAHNPNEGKSAKISSVIFKLFGLQYLLAGVPYFLESIMKIGQAYVFGLLLDSLKYSSKDESYKWTGILCGLAFTQYVCSQSKFFYVRYLY